MTVSQNFLVSNDLDSFEEYWLGMFWNIPLKGFVWCFSHNQTGVVGFEEKDCRYKVTISSQDIKGTCYEPDLSHPTPVLLPGKAHGWRSLVGCSPWGREQSDTIERLHFHFSLSFIGEGNGNPLQCSCLENPGGGGAWCCLWGRTELDTTEVT